MYVQGYLSGVGEELPERLARGYFPIQDSLDLHGLDRDGALADLKNSVRAAVGRGAWQGLLVHRKGLDSSDGEPVVQACRGPPGCCASASVPEGVGLLYRACRRQRRRGPVPDFVLPTR
jgi:hypothetical protein